MMYMIEHVTDADSAREFIMRRVAEFLQGSMNLASLESEVLRATTKAFELGEAEADEGFREEHGTSLDNISELVLKYASSSE